MGSVSMNFHSRPTDRPPTPAYLAERSHLAAGRSFWRHCRFAVPEVPAPSVPQSAGRDGDDHVALLVTQVDVAVRLDDLVQRVAAVDHRPKGTALGEFLQHQQV